MHRHLSRLIERYPSLQPCLEDITASFLCLREVFSSSGKLLLCGNGGSAADCEHIVGELMKGFVKFRPISAHDQALLKETGGTAGSELAKKLQGTLPAIALTSQVSLGSAVANDTGAEMIFAQQVYGLGRRGDALLGISTSGNSINVLNAFIVGRALGLKTIALTGESGGKLRPLADVCIRVPAQTVTEIQEMHLPVYHALCTELEDHFFAQ